MTRIPKAVKNGICNHNFLEKTTKILAIRTAKYKTKRSHDGSIGRENTKLATATWITIMPKTIGNAFQSEISSLFDVLAPPSVIF